jgi:hypothetical protein
VSDRTVCDRRTSGNWREKPHRRRGAEFWQAVHPEWWNASRGDVALAVPWEGFVAWPVKSRDDSIPEDVQEAFARAAKAPFDWNSIGGDEPTVVVHGRPTLISIIAALAETYEDMMPADLYWPMVHHANCSPRRRLQASKLSHDSSYATGAKCLLEWVRDKESESKVYMPTS